MGRNASTNNLCERNSEVMNWKTGGVFVEQVIRPTGLIDPPIEARKTKHQIDDLIDECKSTIGMV